MVSVKSAESWRRKLDERNSFPLPLSDLCAFSKLRCVLPELPFTQIPWKSGICACVFPWVTWFGEEWSKIHMCTQAKIAGNLWLEASFLVQTWIVTNFLSVHHFWAFACSHNRIFPIAAFWTATTFPLGEKNCLICLGRFFSLSGNRLCNLGVLLKLFLILGPCCHTITLCPSTSFRFAVRPFIGIIWVSKLENGGACMSHVLGNETVFVLPSNNHRLSQLALVLGILT